MWESVRLAHHDPRWRHHFDAYRSEMLQAGEGWITAVEHIGSTSIPRLIASPVIDMVAGVLDAGCMAPAATRLERLGYRRFPLPCWTRDLGELLVVNAPTEASRVVYLTLFGGPLWHRLTVVRDRLRQNPHESQRFEDAKVHRWRVSEGDPRDYHLGKSIFFTHLEEQITAASRAEG